MEISMNVPQKSKIKTNIYDLALLYPAIESKNIKGYTIEVCINPSLLWHNSQKPGYGIILGNYQPNNK
jgi:hypothetical protein